MLKHVREHLKVARASGVYNGEHDASESSLKLCFAEDIDELLSDIAGRVLESTAAECPQYQRCFPMALCSSKYRPYCSMGVMMPLLCDRVERPRATVDHCRGNDTALFQILLVNGGMECSLSSPHKEVVKDYSFVAQWVVGFVELAE